MTLHVVMPDGRIQSFNSITPALDSALRSGGTPVEVSGSNIVHQYSLRQHEGGWLLDNCPLNVIMGMGWFPGQQESLASAGIHCAVSAPMSEQEYIPPDGSIDCGFGMKQVGAGCDRDWSVSAEEMRRYQAEQGNIPAYAVSNAPMPLTDDTGAPVTMATQTTTTPQTYSGAPSYDSGGWSGGGIIPGGNGAVAEDGEGIGIVPVLIGAAVLFALTRKGA